MKTLQEWESLFAAEMHRRMPRSFKTRTENPGAQNPVQDPAHDMAHLGRVVATAKRLAEQEGAKVEVVIPAAWFHDLVNLPKDDPQRSMASRLSAAEAVSFLRDIGYDLGAMEEIAHAIEAHSFSAGIEPRTLEAKIVQDADRLDALGAIGIARCFTVGALLGRPFYDSSDPFAEQRSFDDRAYTIDHFPVKLLKLADTLQTSAGREEGERRSQWMKSFLDRLREEIGFDQSQRL